MTVRWGVMGTGGVSGLFAEAVAATEGGEVVAVASRTQARADDFADQWGIEGRCDYESLGGWSVDAVYVATPPALHNMHAQHYLNAGKHVLCEKPLTTTRANAASMAVVAKDRGVFLMEAMWCRFLPAYTRLRQLLDQRYVGDVVSVEASFGVTQPNRGRPEWSAELGGGALLTGGMYPIQLAHMVLGRPDKVEAFGVANDVDESSCALLSYVNGAVATISSAITTNLSNGARINGTEGSLTLSSVTQPEQIGGDRDAPTPLFTGPLRLLPEVDHVHQCIAAGLTESPIMPLAESVAVAETIDKIRACL